MGYLGCIENEYDDDLYLQRTYSSSEASIEDLDAIQKDRLRRHRITEEGRQHQLDATFGTGGGFLGKAFSRGVCGVGVLSTQSAMSIDSFKLLTTHRTFTTAKMWIDADLDHHCRLISKIKLRRARVEAFYMNFQKFYREEHRRTSEKLHIGSHDLKWN